MRTEKEVLLQFDKWATENDLIRAAILTSSRTQPVQKTDFLSDYDIELYVSDLEPFKKDDQWLNVFGPIMVRWPNKPRSTDFGDAFITRLVLFKDYVRIDFQITDKTIIDSNEYEDGYRVLVDKDNLTDTLNQPTFQKNIIQKPSKDKYEKLINEFWWNATYVPKYLWRDELPFAASLLGQSIRDKYLKTIIDWYIGIQHNWSINTGVCGKRFKQYLDVKTWSEYESTFATASLEEQWQAFFNAVNLFRRLAKIVADRFGYEYPMLLDNEMSAYYSFIRNTPRKTKIHYQNLA